ncbi:hypothetical protein Golax_007805, partial [Gossypium laxum]|nr:hypothetical protein [Gossypium laxum]
MRNVPKLLRYDHAVLVRWFSNGAQSSVCKREDVAKIRPLGYAPAERETVSKFVGSHPVSYCLSKKTISRTVMRPGIPMGGVVYSRGLLWNLIPVSVFSSQALSRRGFASDAGLKLNFAALMIAMGCYLLVNCSICLLRHLLNNANILKLLSGLPPCQEIGMPSLSPTMTEGNIARWLKKEGDKVSPGEVLCEVETVRHSPDKATVEMECMEEGYLAKIIKGDGSKEIKVGEIIAITVEEEGDIAKFKDYSPPASDSGAPAAKDSAAPPPPKQEPVEQPASSPEPKTPKPTSSPSEDRIFASPLARKLAEEHQVPLSSIKGTGPDGHIVKADIEDYLASRGKEVSAPTPKTKDAKLAALDYVDIPHSQIRKVTASRLLFSKQTIPHYYLTVDTCVDKLMDLRSQLNSLQEASGGKRISVNDLVIK